MAVRLLALILVPLVGVSVAAAAEIATLAHSASDAARAERAVRAASSIDAATDAYEQEITPAFTAATKRNPALLGGPTHDIAKPHGMRTLSLHALRTRTDAAMARLDVSPAARARFVSMLATARSDIDNATNPGTALDGGSALLAGLAAAERIQLRAAERAGLDPAGDRALTDVQLAANASQRAAAEVGAYTPTQFVTGPRRNAVRARATKVWAVAVSAAQDLEQGGTQDLVAAWRKADREPVVRGFNTFLAQQIYAGTPFVGVPVVTRLVIPDGPRNLAYASVLQTAVTDALNAGDAQRHNALRMLDVTAAVLLVMIGLSIAVSVLIARSITRPLGRLAAQATRVSEGHLIDVQISGPTEVRTVATALAASVAGLRAFGAYATAAVAGDLDASVVPPKFPGPLGEVVHSSVARIIGAVDEQKVAELALAHRATHDTLTELPNRGQAVVYIEAALDTAALTMSHTALLFIDLDRFKPVNDTHGYAAGNQVLQGVANRLAELVGPDDTVARFGGDEFVVLVEDVDDEEAVAAMAAGIVAELSTPMTVEGTQVQIGASVGLSFCRPGSVDAVRLVQEADAAMRRAKAHGGGRVDTFDDHLRRELLERHELEAAIAAGLQRDEFELYYQPVVNLQSGAVTEVEALIRWNRPGHGLAGPDSFIPVAERSALIKDVGRWVLGQAARQLAIWRDSPAHAELSVAVNISGSHLTSPQLVADVTDGLIAAGVDASHLILEITETVLVDDDPVAIANLQTLRAMGARISLDDFGTGFTSIGRIPTLPVDILKIDRSFVASEDTDHTSLVLLMVGAAHAFGLTVIAEGIETVEQADQMRQAGVELGQGYLFARPNPVDRLDVNDQPFGRSQRRTSQRKRPRSATLVRPKEDVRTAGRS